MRFYHVAILTILSLPLISCQPGVNPTPQQENQNPGANPLGGGPLGQGIPQELPLPPPGPTAGQGANPNEAIPNYLPPGYGFPGMYGGYPGYFGGYPGVAAPNAMGPGLGAFNPYMPYGGGLAGPLGLPGGYPGLGLQDYLGAPGGNGGGNPTRASVAEELNAAGLGFDDGFGEWGPFEGGWGLPYWGPFNPWGYGIYGKGGFGKKGFWGKRFGKKV
ncbi:hypothetical protein HK098_001865 [Nowakowskiella sp. JEL0407]|nr:hypothetical protein HK098_001865 [Nowakowskiella sp. JEL0407]